MGQLVRQVCGSVTCMHAYAHAYEALTYVCVTLVTAAYARADVCMCVCECVCVCAIVHACMFMWLCH